MALVPRPQPSSVHTETWWGRSVSGGRGKGRRSEETEHTGEVLRRWGWIPGRTPQHPDLGTRGAVAGATVLGVGGRGLLPGVP